MTDTRNDKLQPYWTPDPGLVEQRKQGPVMLSYVSHVHTQATLDEIDPAWTLDLCVAADGNPLIMSRKWQGNRGDGVTLTLWGRMTVLGSTRWCVGSVEAGKPDAEKELLGDLIRNGAMRHGVFGSLWAKEMPGKAPESHRERPAPRTQGQTTRQEEAFSEAIVSDWTDDPLQQASWTTEHVGRTAKLLRSTPEKIMDRLLTGLAEKGHDTANGWADIAPDEWVRAVLTFEGWAERKASERASA